MDPTYNWSLHLSIIFLITHYRLCTKDIFVNKYKRIAANRTFIIC